MIRLLYLSKRNIFLVKRWLREHPKSRVVCIILTENLPNQIELLCSEFPQIVDFVHANQEEVDSVAWQLGDMDLHHAIIPMSGDTVQMRRVKNTFTPKIQHLYPIVRVLWFAGVRTIEIYSLSGSRILQLPYLLDAFVDLHKGQRCFVVGNGPSLNKIDMSLLSDEITLGSNRSFLGYEKWGYSFKYWGIVDRVQIEEYWQEYEDNIPSEGIKFFPFEYLSFLQFENSCPLNHFYGVPDYPQFSAEPDKIYLGHSVTYMLLQIAAVMGCNPIILIGVDHNYSLEDRELGKLNQAYSNAAPRRINRVWQLLKRRFPSVTSGSMIGELGFLGSSSDKKKSGTLNLSHELWTAKDAKASTHFDDRYTAGNKRFVPPRPELAEQAYTCAAEWGRANGVEIVNATPGSALEVFKKIQYEDLFP